MSQTIKLKRGTSTPTTSNIVSGEVAIDTSAKKLYINDAGTIKEIGGGLSSISVSDVPNLPASKITSGTFTAARIPNLNASKITAGTIALARLPTIPYSQLSGTPTIPTSLPANGGNSDTVDNLHGSQFLRSDTADTWTGQLSWGGAGGDVSALNLNNANITGVNRLVINDPGEGIQFNGSNNIQLYAIDDATDTKMNFASASELQVNGRRVFEANYHPNADKWTTARTHTVTLTGDVTGSAAQNVDGTGNKTWSITTAVANDSHTHDGRYFTEAESDARYLRKDQGNANWTRLGYGTSGTAYWHKLAEVTINGSYKDYQLRCDWTDRYNHGTLNIHIHSDNDNTADVWDAYVQQFGKTNRKSMSHFKYYKSGSTVQVWIHTQGWREFDYIRRDAITEGEPAISWYKEGDSGAGKTTTEPSGLTGFSDYTPWHLNNDGSGSGLDADRLDGQDSAYYLNYNNLTNKPSIPSTSNFVTLNGTQTNISGYKGFTANVGISSQIQHLNDSNTYLQFDDDRIRLVAGGTTKFDTSNDYVTTNTAQTITGVKTFAADVTVSGNRSATFYAFNGAYLKATTDARAPIFYDHNDTTYYADPNGLSVLKDLRTGNDHHTNAPRWDTSFYVAQSQHWYGHSSSQVMFLGESANPVRLRGTLNIGSNADVNTSMRLTVRGHADATDSLRAPIFYDSDNTGYYLNPNGTSNLNVVNVATLDPAKITQGFQLGDNNGGRLYFGHNATRSYFAPRNSGDTDWAWGREFGFNVTDDRWYVDGTLFASDSLRAPAFYDSNNTARYVDPTSTSQMTHINMNNGNLSGVNHITINDPGPTEGISWAGGNGWKIVESPDDLTTNSGGNLQFATGSTRRMTLSSGGDLTTPTGSVYTSRVYDRNDTGYLSDPASSSRLNNVHTNYLGLGTGNNTSGGYRLNMGGSIDMNGNNIDYVSQLHFNDNVRFYDGGNDSYLNFKYGDATEGGIILRDNASNAKGYLYASTSGFGLLDNDGHWAVRTQTGTNPLILYTDSNPEFYVYTSYTYSPGSSRAPIFYDSNNTSYYIHADSESVLNAVRGHHFRVSSGDGKGIRFWNSDSYKIYMSATSNSTHGGRAPYESTSDYNMYFRMTGGTNRGFVFRNDTTNVAGIDASGNFNTSGIIKTGNGAASAPAYAFTGDYNSGMFSLGSDAVGFSTGGTQRFKINSNGLLLTGTSSLWVNGQQTITNTRDIANVVNYQNTDGHMQLHRTGNAPLIINRMGTTGSSGTSRGEILNFKSAGTKIGRIGYAQPYGGVMYLATGNTTGAGLGFYNIYSTGYIFPCTHEGATLDNSLDLGSSGGRFDDVYATNGTIQTSDRNEKQDIQELTDAETRAAVTCKGLMRRFRWVDSVEEKGDDARYHFGAIAQDVEAAFTAEGLDAGDYGLFIRTTWWEHEGHCYPSADVAPEGAVEKTRLGIRYNQLFAFIIGAL